MDRIKSVLAIGFALLLTLFFYGFVAKTVRAQSGCEGFFRCCTSRDVHGNCLTEGSTNACSGGSESTCEDPSRFCPQGVTFNSCGWTAPDCRCNYSHCQLWWPGAGSSCVWPDDYCNAANPYCFWGSEYYDVGACTGSSTCRTESGGFTTCSSCSYGYGDEKSSPGYGFEMCIASCGGGPTPTPVGPTPTPIPAPSCTVSLTPVSASTLVGGTVSFTASVIPSDGTVDSVNFSSSNAGVATVLPSSDLSSPYNTIATGVSAGSSTIRSDVVMGGSVRCSDTSSLTVTPPPLCTAPTPTAPPTSSCDSSDLLDVTWSWAAIVGATSYRLQVDNNLGFPSPEFNVTTSATSYATNDLTPGTWYGRVRVETSTIACTSPSAWSATSTITRYCCSVSLPPSYSPAAGSTVGVFPGISQPAGTIDEVLFTTNPTYASVCAFASGPCLPPTGSYTDTPGFSADLTGVSIGTTTLTASGTMTNEPGGPYACTPDTAAVNATNPNPWFQVKEGDMTSNGNISTVIPATCALPACDPVLITNDAGDGPGVPSFTGTINPGPPALSSTNWNAGASYQGSTPDYAFFESKLPSGIPFTNIPGPTVAGSVFNSGGTLYRGYYWYRYAGGAPLTISSAVSIPAGRRVVFMSGDDLLIAANINLVDGRSFFMVLTQGDIRVLGSAGGAPGSGPHLEGLFLADQQFRTEPGSNQVHLRGVISGLGMVGGVVGGEDGVFIERDLPDNSQTPAEIFEFGADQILLFPPSLSERRMSWREVAP